MSLEHMETEKALTWKADYNARRAFTECGDYEITWTSTPSGTHYQAFVMENESRSLLGLGVCKEFVKYLCQVHAISVRQSRKRSTGNIE